MTLFIIFFTGIQNKKGKLMAQMTCTDVSSIYILKIVEHNATLDWTKDYCGYV